LGLLLTQGNKYFLPNKGYNIDLSKIIRLCLSNSDE